MYYKVDLTRLVEEKCTVLVKIDSPVHNAGDKKFVYDLLTRDLSKNLSSVPQVVFHDNWRMSDISKIKVDSITSINKAEYLNLHLESASQEFYRSVSANVTYS